LFPLSPSALAVVVALLAVRLAAAVDDASIAFVSAGFAVLGGALAVAGGARGEGTVQRTGLGLAGVGYYLPAVVMGAGDPLEMYAVLVTLLAGSSATHSAWRYHRLVAGHVGEGPSLKAMVRNMRTHAGRMVAAAVITFLASAVILNLSLTSSFGFVDPITAFLMALVILVVLVALATRLAPEAA
jgi:hypothetical protein